LEKNYLIFHEKKGELESLGVSIMILKGYPNHAFTLRCARMMMGKWKHYLYEDMEKIGM
jgi:hypothetical protein